MPQLIRRSVPFVLALALVLVPASFASASPFAFGAPTAQASSDGGMFAWIAGWFQDLLGGQASAQVDAGQGVGFGPQVPQPTDDTSGLTSESREDGERGPAIQVDG